MWCQSVTIDGMAAAAATVTLAAATDRAALGVRVYNVAAYRTGTSDYSAPAYWKIVCSMKGSRCIKWDMRVTKNVLPRRDSSAKPVSPQQHA